MDPDIGDRRCGDLGHVRRAGLAEAGLRAASAASDAADPHLDGGTYVAASERSRVPYGKIRRLNTGLLALYLLAALLLCIGLTAVCSESEAVFLIPYAALMLLGYIVGAIIWLIMLIANWLSGGRMGAAGAAPRPFDLEAAEALFPWMHTLWIIVDVIIVVIGSAFVIYMIYLSLYSLYYGFLAVDPETGDTRKRKNTKETRRKTRSGTRTLPILAGIGPAAGIRRAYISLIRMYPEAMDLPKFGSGRGVEGDPSAL